MTERYVDVIAELALRFPKQEISEETQAAYALDLADLPYDELRYVCQWLWRTEEWFPAIATIRKTWAELALRDVVLPEGEAVRWAMRQIRRIGGWTANGGFVEPVDYPDPVVERMMVNFGWSRLAHSEDDDWTRKELAKAYQQARQTVSEQVMAGTIMPPPMALPDGPQRPALKAVS